MELIRVIRKSFDIYSTEGSNCIIVAELELNLGVGMSYPAPKSDTSHIHSGYGVFKTHPRIPGNLYSLFMYPDCVVNDVVLVEDMGPELIVSRISLAELGPVLTIEQLRKQIEDFLLRIVFALSPIDW